MGVDRLYKSFSITHERDGHTIQTAYGVSNDSLKRETVQNSALLFGLYDLILALLGLKTPYWTLLDPQIVSKVIPRA